MSAELDMSQYLDLFLQEADEQLLILEQELLKLEEEAGRDRLDTIFRAAHTLKGSSRAMGFLTFAGLTHEMESLLEQLRSGRLSPSTEITNSLLKCLDALVGLKEGIAAGQGESGEFELLMAELRRHAAAPAVEAVEAAREGYRADIRLKADCAMKFVRAFMVLSLVQDGGELIDTVPGMEELEEEKFEQDFSVMFRHSDAQEVLQEKLLGIGEVEAVSLTPWSPVVEIPAPAPAEEPAKAEATPKAEETKAEAVAKKADSGQTVRVDVSRLDDLMNLVGELVVDRTRATQLGADLATKYDQDDQVALLGEAMGHIGRITGDLQDQIMKARMLPIETVFNRFPRMVRDLAQKIGKDVRLELAGGSTELDRSVIEAIGDPLLHILRNSVDHGIEKPEDRLAAGKAATGRILVSARHEENHIVVQVEDDGRGIDHERVRRKAVESGLVSADAAAALTPRECLQFIFANGLSTAAEVSEVSGRGVGMDIVKANVQKLGGLIEVDTAIGRGTKFSLRLPLTLAIIRGLTVWVAGVVYVVPLASVVETLRLSLEAIQKVHGNEVVVVRGMTTPLVRLREEFGVGLEGKAEGQPSYAVIVGLADQRIGLVVDKLIGETEVVIKALSPYCGDVRGISGATILGDGNVALIVDVSGLLTDEL